MKSNSLEISVILFMTFIFTIVCLIIDFEVQNINGTVKENSDEPSVYDNDSQTRNPGILINTTNISECLPSYTSYDVVSETYSKEKLRINKNSEESNITVGNNNTSTNNNKFCEFYKVSESLSCVKYFANQSKKSCELDATEDDDGESKKLDTNNFSDKGLLLADTKFGTQYTFESIDPINPDNKIRVSLDFNKHSQGDLDNINSPRIDLVRENSDGEPNMSTAKNQIISWQGNVKEYFREPQDKYQNETYIVIQFNTGQHGSNKDDQERGFGVLFDVSSDSNPNLFEYRDDGNYVKYDYETIKQLAGDSFVFHNLDENGKPLFINNLTDRDNVMLKVITYLTGNNSRTVETFVDNGKGMEIPYWTINDLTKLKEHDKVEKEDNFMDTINQGSGYVIARTDNIDTRLFSFKSLDFEI